MKYNDDGMKDVRRIVPGLCGLSLSSRETFPFLFFAHGQRILAVDKHILAWVGAEVVQACARSLKQQQDV